MQELFAVLRMAETTEGWSFPDTELDSIWSIREDAERRAEQLQQISGAFSNYAATVVPCSLDPVL